MGDHTVSINGRELPSWTPCRVYDQNNIAVDISGFIVPGLNNIDVKVQAAEDWHGLSDPMYLLGNFGVFGREGQFVLGRAPAAAKPTAKAVEGFPFYSGKISFMSELQAENPGCDFFTVEIPEKYRIYECVEISVNGRDLGVRAFSPYIWRGPAGILKQGRNEVKLTITNTLGNMFEACYYDYDVQKTVYI